MSSVSFVYFIDCILDHFTRSLNCIFFLSQQPGDQMFSCRVKKGNFSPEQSETDAVQLIDISVSAFTVCPPGRRLSCSVRPPESTDMFVF